MQLQTLLSPTLVMPVSALGEFLKGKKTDEIMKYYYAHV